MIKGSMIFEKSEFFLDNLICRCYNKQQITEVHSYVVFCIQQNESSASQLSKQAIGSVCRARNFLI